MKLRAYLLQEAMASHMDRDLFERMLEAVVAQGYDLDGEVTVEWPTSNA